MNHPAWAAFWKQYHQLPKRVQALADKNFDRLKVDPSHPSLRFKKVGGTKQLWSVRVGAHHRALGEETPDGVEWYWIGSHADYDNRLA